MSMHKVLMIAAGTMFLAGAAHASCIYPAGPDVPYDYFNRSWYPRVELSGLSCQSAMDNQVYYEDATGDPGTVSRTSTLWSWSCFDPQVPKGTGLSLAYAAKQLTIWGCSGGTLIDTRNGNTIPY